MRKDQRGFTIVELIIAVAILAIVTLAVGGFMVVGSRSYTSANTDIMLQQDAQLALNQISDVIIDTTDSISYSVGDSSGLQTVLKDSEYGGEATDKCLTVVNRKEPDSNNDNPSYWFYWSKEKETIYFNEVPVDSTMSEEEIKNGFADAEIAKAVLAEHVTDLQIDVSQFEENRVVMISMTFENGGRQYSTSNNVTVRNRIALNAIDVAPMKIADEFLITNLSPVTLEPGDDYTFEAHVDTSSDDRELKCELSGNADSDTRITGADSDTRITSVTTADGGKTVRIAVHVGIKEMRSNFLLKVSRAHEQYDGQNKRVSVSAQIKVKRVNAVNITGPASAKQGATVSLTGSASGPQLGYSCNSAACAGDEIAKDHDLIDTRWVVTSGNATIANPTKNSADVMIAANAVPGEDVVVRAYSQLSATKNGGYGIASQGWSAPIYGEWRIRVEQGIQGDAPLRSDFKFGTDNDEEVGMIYDYMYEGLSDYRRYVLCVRVRELNASGADNDQVVLYWASEGKNVRFNPDMFGVDFDRSYNVYMQVLLPVDQSQYKGQPNKAANQFSEDSKETIKAEYKANLDGNGKYVGTRYEASKLFYGKLTPPAISVVYNNVTYPNDNKDHYESYSLFSGGDPVVGQILFGDVMNIKPQTLNGKIVFTIYKGEGEGIESWQRVSGYDPGRNAYDNPSIFGDGEFRIEVQTSGVPALTSSNFIRRNAKNNPPSAVGMYHIVPGYRYANQYNLGNYDFILQENLNGDYDEHYYVQPKCTINLKVGMEFNMELPPENGEQRFTNFPVPTDFAFPFALKSEFVQTVKKSLPTYTKSGNESGWRDFLVDCEYVPGANGERDSYTIWLYTESNRNGASYTRNVIGKYTCKVGDDKWDMVRWNYQEDVKVETNIDYRKDNHNWKAYFPYPSESGFPFKGLLGGSSDKVMYRLQAYNVDSNYEKKMETLIAECELESGGDYVLTLKEVVSGGAHKSITKVYGQWKCSAAGKEWKKSQDGSETATPVWGSRLYFTYNGQNCMMEVAAPSGANQTISGTKQYYFQSDEYGEKPQNANFDLIYTKESDGSYTVTLCTKETQGKAIVYTNYGKGKWNATTKGWDAETFDEKVYVPVGWGTLVHFTYNGQNYKVERPLPNESGFPTFSEKYEENITGSISYETNMTGWAQDGQGWLDMVAEYQRDTSGKYTLTLRTSTDWAGNYNTYGTWTWEPGQTEWQKQ